MQQNRHIFVSRFLWVLTLFALLAFCAATTAAQRTEVKKNGAGKIEIDYNAAGQATEMRTIGADGKVQQKVDYEHLPGYYAAQQTDTTYWPNGQVRRIARNTFDPSSNFTGEFIQVFDESGKQVAGHNLTHDPMTGVYTCADWNTAAQNYKSIKCPAGEEGGEGPEEVKKFTYTEVMQHLEAARKAATGEQKTRRMHPMTPVQSPITTANKEIGLVLPAQMRAGERISGTVVEDPEKYDAMPEVKVFRMTIPFESAGEASHLQGWNFEAPGEGPQPADGPVSLTVPRAGSGLTISLRQIGSPDHSVTQPLDLSSSAAKTKPQMLRSFKAAALCLKGQLCTVVGPFSGDSRKTFAAFEERPAGIVAETTEAAYLDIPERTEAGSRPLFIAEGHKVVALPVAVGNFFIRNIGRKLEAGQTLIVFPTLDGPGDIPDALWRPGNFPATNLEQAQKLVPGFKLPQPDREAREKREAHEKQEAKQNGQAKDKKKQEAEGGEILLVVKNPMPEQIALRGSKDQMIVFHLNDQTFSRGEFKYDLVVEALKPGPVDVKGYVIPFLAPVTGQEFTVKTGTTGK